MILMMEQGFNNLKVVYGTEYIGLILSTDGVPLFKSCGKITSSSAVINMSRIPLLFCK